MSTKIEDKPIAHAGADSSPRCAVSSCALAERIVTAVEGRFRDWLMSGEHAEAVQLVAEILERELDEWTVQSRALEELGQCADGLAACLDVLRHPLDDTALRLLRRHRQLRRTK